MPGRLTQAMGRQHMGPRKQRQIKGLVGLKRLARGVQYGVSKRGERTEDEG